MRRGGEIISGMGWGEVGGHVAVMAGGGVVGQDGARRDRARQEKMARVGWGGRGGTGWVEVGRGEIARNAKSGDGMRRVGCVR